MSTITEDEIVAAEKRGYSKGYQAGKKRVSVEVSTARAQAADRAFVDRVFLAALPSCIVVDYEPEPGKPVKSIAERTRLAWSYANEAIRQRRIK